MLYKETLKQLLSHGAIGAYMYVYRPYATQLGCQMITDHAILSVVISQLREKPTLVPALLP